MHLTDEPNHPLTLAHLKWACVAVDQFVQAAAHRDNTSKREYTSMQSMMCVRLFMENEHDTQQLTTTRRWSSLSLRAITALQRKEALKLIDVDNSGKMALIEYLLWKYKKTVSQVANASQGFQFFFEKFLACLIFF